MVDWKKHFESLSNNHINDFGTIGGLYTIAEVNDLIRAKDAAMSIMKLDYDKFADKWHNIDSAAADKWLSDYNTLSANYQKTKDDGQALIKDHLSSSIIPDNMNPADNVYRAILTTLNSAWQQDTWIDNSGSLDDLQTRLSKAGAPTTKYKVPQPGQGSDFDINVYKKTDKLDVLGNPGGFFKAHWKPIAGIGVGLLVINRILGKVGL